MVGIHQTEDLLHCGTTISEFSPQKATSWTVSVHVKLAKTELFKKAFGSLYCIIALIVSFYLVKLIGYSSDVFCVRSFRFCCLWSDFSSFLWSRKVLLVLDLSVHLHPKTRAHVWASIECFLPWLTSCFEGKNAGGGGGGKWRWLRLWFFLLNARFELLLHQPATPSL